MDNSYPHNLSKTAIIFVVLTAIFHVLFFVAESILWLQPYIYENFLSQAGQFEVDINTQAKIMETVFFNQGFYNLFLALGLLYGLFTFHKSRSKEAQFLIKYICLYCVGAALVLFFSAGAIKGAIVQGIPPLVALIAIYFNNKHSAEN